MKNKRLILVLLFLGLLPISCWKTTPAHFRINNLSISIFNDEQLNTPVAVNDTLNGAKTFFKLNLNIRYIGSLLNVDFSNQLYAFSKPRPGGQGLKEKLADIKITSDKLFNGRTPGTNLKDLFYWNDIQWDNKQKSIDNLRDKLNQEEFFLGQSSWYLKLILTQKPTDSLTHHLTFDFFYSGGTNQTATTNSITWK